jgi:hypothetical protein
MRTAFAMLAVLLGIAAAAASAAEMSAPQPAPRCEVAVVNPVSGYAECVKPRGVPVDAPPKRSAPTPEECQKHQDLDAEACRASAAPENPHTQQ